MKAVKTWVLIADGARARILLNDGVGHGLSEVPGLEFGQSIPDAKDILADRPGRTFDSHGTGRHAIERTSDPVREEKKRFGDVLANFLDEQLNANAFDRLVVIAAPKTLGDLRAAFSKDVAACVYAELDKDLTKVPNDEMAKHLKDTLAV